MEPELSSEQYLHQVYYLCTQEFYVCAQFNCLYCGEPMTLSFRTSDSTSYLQCWQLELGYTKGLKKFGTLEQTF